MKESIINIKASLEKAFDQTSLIQVSGLGVDHLAEVRNILRAVYSAVSELEKAEAEASET